ncbi:MAG: response regulator [Chloroflexi bacterium]|nr:response regulator [Chloroflexota bacterium]
MADSRKDKVLIIDHDPDERATLVETALIPFGYDVKQTGDGGSAITLVGAEQPDVIVLDLHLEGLAGSDVLAAIQAQAMDIPVIVLANEGREDDALHAFRLGAKDYLVRPIRETELIQSIERALKEIRLRRERESLVGEVRQAGKSAQQRLQELQTLMSIGKSVTALRNLDEIFERVGRAAIQLTQAEATGLILKEDQSSKLILQSGRNLSRALQEKIGEAIEDDLAQLVMTSGEAYIGSGKGLEKFKPAQEGANAVIYAPLLINERPVGILWVANTRLVFEDFMKELVTALADYAAIAIVNARLFKTMQERSQQLEAANQALRDKGIEVVTTPTDGEALNGAGAKDLAGKLRAPLTTILGNMNLWRTGELGQIPLGNQAAVDVMHRQLSEVISMIDALVPPDTKGL